MNEESQVRSDDGVSEEEALMRKHGISCEHRTIYFHKSYRYERLEDAVAYAKLESEKTDVI